MNIKKNDLITLSKLSDLTTNQDILYSLNKDKKVITNTSKELVEKRIGFTSNYLNKESILDIMTHNKFLKNTNKKVKLSKRISSKVLDEIFIDFLITTNIPLFELYTKMKKHNIIYTTIDENICGSTVYIKSLLKNYIIINDATAFDKKLTLIHELGHAFQNLNGYKQTDYYSTCFMESFSSFLELQFIDYLRKNGFKEKSFNEKVNIINEIISNHSILNDSLDSYLSDNISTIDKLIFDYKYKQFMSDLLCLYFYSKYKSNDYEELLDCFNMNYAKVNDKEMLRILGIPFETFKYGSCVKKFEKELSQEKKLIK